MDARTVWTIEFFVDSNNGCPVEQWIASLSDTKFVALDDAIVGLLAINGIALSNSPWMKPLGDGLHELRVRHSPREIASKSARSVLGRDALRLQPEKVLLRIFVHFYGNKRILLLHGYDKARNPSSRYQSQQIQKAKQRLTAWKTRRASIRLYRPDSQNSELE